MKTLHRIINVIQAIAWFILFCYNAINTEHILLKVLLGISTFLVGAYIATNIFYGVVRSKSNVVLLIAYIAMGAGFAGRMIISGNTNLTTVMFVIIAILGIAEYIVYRQIPPKEKSASHA